MSSNTSPAAAIDRYIATLNNHFLREYATRYGVWKFRGPGYVDIAPPAEPARMQLRCQAVRARIDSLMGSCDHLDYTENQDGDMCCDSCGWVVEGQPEPEPKESL